MNIDAPWPIRLEAEARVLGMQIKLHQWAGEDEDRRFDDLYNLVYDPAFLLMAWIRVKENRGARTAGVDDVTVQRIEQEPGVEKFLAELRAELRARAFHPSPVRERMIPKAGGKLRSLGLSPLLANIALSALDDEFAQQWQTMMGHRLPAPPTSPAGPRQLAAHPLRG